MRQIHRSQPGFTEGLEWHDGAIWELTGDLFGESRINRIDPATGQVTSLVNAGKDYFGEGLTFFGGRSYQMTWREHRVFVFDPLFQHEPELSNPREGWGLTHDGSELIASDGSDTLFFLSPHDFSVRREVKVTINGRPLPAIERAGMGERRDLGQCLRGLEPGADCAGDRLRGGYRGSAPAAEADDGARTPRRPGRAQFRAQRRCP